MVPTSGLAPLTKQRLWLNRIEFTPSNFSIFFLYQRVHSLLGLDPGVAIEIESVTAALSSVVGGARLL